MAAFPVEVLLGIYLGLLTGIIPAVVAWGLGFLFKYFTGISIPAFAVIGLALAIAGANGGLLALNDPTVRGAPNSVVLVTAILVILMISITAHAQGDKLGANFPKRLSLRSLRDRTLSADVVERVGGIGHARITVGGEVGDMEGYPPLSADLRAEIGDREWTFPADLPIAELETRVADALRSEYDLADAAVRIDDQGQATVAAAPPSSGVSKLVPAGKRAVSIGALLPTGLARGDEVAVTVDGESVTGTVVSVQSSNAPAAAPSETEEDAATDGGTAGDGEVPPAPPEPATEGGDGRVTLAVDRADATRLLRAETGHLVVRSRGTRREFELLALLRRAGRRFRKLTIRAGSDLDGTTVGDVAIRDTYGVVILAVRRAEGWTLAPRGSTWLAAGDELYAVGTRERLDRFEEVTR